MATKNGIRFRSNTATFTRPNDTNAYASGDLVANATAAASAAPMSWTSPGKAPFEIPCVKLEKSTAANISTALFRVHLFLGTIPTIATTGDNGVFASVVSGKASWFGSYEGQMEGFADGGVAICTPYSGLIRPDMMGTPGDLIYGLVEARAAYTPGAEEVFLATLIQEFGS